METAEAAAQHRAYLRIVEEFSALDCATGDVRAFLGRIGLLAAAARTTHTMLPLEAQKEKEHDAPVSPIVH
jgi:hypothetical protein